MSLQTRLSDYITRIGTEFKTYHTIIDGAASGAFAALTTTATNIIGAINELKTDLDALTVSAGAIINDAAASLTSTYSSTKIEADIAAAVTALVDSSPAALDTLNELAAALGDDANFSTTINAAIALKANSADVYTQTELGDPETDLVALFNAALV